MKEMFHYLIFEIKVSSLANPIVSQALQESEGRLYFLRALHLHVYGYAGYGTKEITNYHNMKNKG